jgi:hypothetical protein
MQRLLVLAGIGSRRRYGHDNHAKRGAVCLDLRTGLGTATSR